MNTALRLFVFAFRSDSSVSCPALGRRPAVFTVAFLGSVFLGEKKKHCKWHRRCVVCDLSRCYVLWVFFYSRESLAEFCLITPTQVIHVSISRIGRCPTLKKQMNQNHVVYYSNTITACKKLWVFHHWNSRKQNHAMKSICLFLLVYWLTTM